MVTQYITQGSKILKWLRQLFVKENKRLPIGNEIEKIKIQATNIDNAFAKAASQGSKVEVTKENINFIVSKLKQDKLKALEKTALERFPPATHKFFGKKLTDQDYREIDELLGPKPNVIDIKSKLPVNAPGFPDYTGLARQTLEKNPDILKSFLLAKRFPHSHKTGIHDVPIVKKSEWDLSAQPRKRAEDTTSIKNFEKFGEGLFSKDEMQKIYTSGQASDVAYVMDNYGMSRDSVMAKINRGEKLIEDLRGIDDFAEGGRIGLFAGKSPKILQALKMVSNKIAPGSTKIGQTSKTLPSSIKHKRETAQSIRDFEKAYAQQESKKRFNRKFKEFVNLNGRGPETPQEWGSLRKAEGGIARASGGLASMLGEPTYMNRPGYSGGTLVKLFNLLKGKKKNVWRGFETDYKNILRGDWYPEEFSGRFFTPDKDLAKWYAMRQGTLTGKVKKLKLTEEEIKAAQEFAEKNLDTKYGEDLLVSKELAEKATVDLPATALAKIEAVIRKAKGTKKAKKHRQTDWAEGGRVPLMYGGDPGFAFEYGGSWADWRDQHQHQMPVTDYIEQKLPKERLPFRDMDYADGGIAHMLGERDDEVYSLGGGVGRPPIGSGVHGPDTTQQENTPVTMGKNPPMMGQSLNQYPRVWPPQHRTHPGQPIPLPHREGNPTGWGSRMPMINPYRPNQMFNTPLIQPSGINRIRNNPLRSQWVADGGRIGFSNGEVVEIDPEEIFRKVMMENYQPTQAEKEKLEIYLQGKAEGGRIGFKKGGMDRRTFLKLMGGLASIPIVGKFFKAAKLAKPSAAVTETIVKSNAPGMPAWFPSLVKKVIKEGDDITDKAAVIERQTVHSTKLPESGTELTVTRDLTTDDIIVDIGYGKHGWKDGWHGQPTRLVLKKGEWIEPTKTKKGKKTPDEFIVEEAEFTGGHPENIKYEDVTIEQYGNHGSDFTEVEKYATGKTTKGSKPKREVWEADWDDVDPENVIDDYAEGGRIGYAAGKIVKGGRWVIKNLERALKELAEGTYNPGYGPMEKEAFKWEIKGLIGRIKMGEPIPEDMIKTMRQDARFKDIVKTRSTDPDLYEMEDVILNYGKKGDVVDEQVEILEKFTPTGKGHASGGLAHMVGE